MKTLDSHNPNFEGPTPQMRAMTVCFIDKRGRLCWIPYGTMDWHFKTTYPTYSFAKWFNLLNAKEVK